MPRNIKTSVIASVPLHLTNFGTVPALHGLLLPPHRSSSHPTVFCGRLKEDIDMGVWRDRLLGDPERYNYASLCVPTAPWKKNRPALQFYGKGEFSFTLLVL